MPTTSGEEAIIQHYKRNFENISGRSIFHIGIGNGSFYRMFAPYKVHYTGLTISKPEIEAFNRRIPGHAANLVFGNKHDARVMQAAVGQTKFDIIADINLKSFACCQAHFDDYIEILIGALNPGGVIVTSERGSNFGWPGNIRKAYTPGASTDPKAATFRVLGLDGLKAIADRYFLDLHNVIVSDVRHRHGTQNGATETSNESIWLLGKRL